MHNTREQRQHSAKACAPAYAQPFRLPDHEHKGEEENGGSGKHRKWLLFK